MDERREVRTGRGDSRGSAGINRRDLLKLSLGGSAVAALPLANLVDMKAVRTAVDGMKLANVEEFTTACNFCSCGCGMIATVKEGKLLTLEGDFDHPVNGGSLCVKGMAILPTHSSPRRLQKPLYRAPGSDQWVELKWVEAAEKIARKIKQVRDETWIATEKVGDAEVPVNRTDAIAFTGGAQNTNEECYLFQKAARLLGTAFVEHQARL
jgi:formate dehydrogenase major subunit